MNHLIFTAVLTAFIGIREYQQGPDVFGPLPERLGQKYHQDPGQFNSLYASPWPPLVSPYSTISIAVYTTIYYVLSYFTGNFGRYNTHAKLFCWLMTVYPVVTTLTGFQFSNLGLYVMQVIPTALGYYRGWLKTPVWVCWLVGARLAGVCSIEHKLFSPW